ncbi:MAG: hypothetical protein Q8P02_00620 [Candidatus Micrarchaeota archaeon]|nr:hypothetical protein [Candidatus Micrarchaeota archaeon]
MKRGQAFVTLLLVISVIVAVAILGIFVNTLFHPAPDQFANPESVMKDQLKSIVSSGFGISQAKKVEFKTGSLILRQSIVANVPITIDELRFACNSVLCDGNTLQVTDNAIEVKRDLTDYTYAKRDLTGYISVCGNDASGQNPKYCVGIGRQAPEARDACMRACNIER